MTAEPKVFVVSDSVLSDFGALAKLVAEHSDKDSKRVQISNARTFDQDKVEITIE